MTVYEKLQSKIAHAPSSPFLRDKWLQFGVKVFCTQIQAHSSVIYVYKHFVSHKQYNIRYSFAFSHLYHEYVSR